MLCSGSLDMPSQFGWNTQQCNPWGNSDVQLVQLFFFLSIATVEFLSHIGFLMKAELNLKQLPSVWNILDKLRRHQGTTPSLPPLPRRSLHTGQRRELGGLLGASSSGAPHPGQHILSPDHPTNRVRNKDQLF